MVTQGLRDGLTRTCYVAALFICFHLSLAGNAKHDQGSRGYNVEELFRRRTEAPNSTHILDNIFKGYDERIRPHYRGKPEEICLYAVVNSFHDIREEQMEYKVDLVLKESWSDPRLAYGNVTWFVRLKGDTLKRLWIPDTLVENSRKHDVEEKTRTALLFGDGTIFYSEWVKATLTSHMDLHNFPMDVQTLRIQIAAYSYDDTQVQYHWTKVVIIEKDMTEFYVEKQSIFMEPTSYISGTHTAAVAEFKVRRRLQHYVIEFYLPCIACTIASWVQFWMEESDIGNRAGLGITTVLTEIFLLEFSNQGMPKVSYMKSAELFVVVSFSFIFLALVESALVYKAAGLSNKQDDSQMSKDSSSSNSVSQGKDSSEKHSELLLKSSLLISLSDFNKATYHENATRSSESIFPEVGIANGDHPPDTASSETNNCLHKSNWSLLIDRGARLLFPILYFSFTIVYFTLIL